MKVGVFYCEMLERNMLHQRLQRLPSCSSAGNVGKCKSCHDFKG